MTFSKTDGTGSAPDSNGRPPDCLRPVSMEPGWATHAEGSVLIRFGDTCVLCTASVEESVPAWREKLGAGWVTGEYGMLPRSTHTRRSRERSGPGGRTREIERLIGRSLRSVTDLQALGPRTIRIDCDVLQADGGTRTASVTGGWVALVLACRRLVEDGRLEGIPVRDQVAAVSSGWIDGSPHLDLDYELDSRARVDLNVVAAPGDRIVEIQGTAEGDPLPRARLDELTSLALQGIGELHGVQMEVLRRSAEEVGSGGSATP